MESKTNIWNLDENENNQLVKILYSEEPNFSEEFEEYLANLTSFNLERLTKEPAKLKQEGKNIREQMEQLAFNNYKAFIQTSDCVQELHKEVNLFTTHL